MTPLFRDEPLHLGESPLVIVDTMAEGAILAVGVAHLADRASKSDKLRRDPQVSLGLAMLDGIHALGDTPQTNADFADFVAHACQAVAHLVHAVADALEYFDRDVCRLH